MNDPAPNNSTVGEPSDDVIRKLLTTAKTIAVVGLSPKEHRDSHQVSKYLQQAGYRIVPIYPREETILGETVYPSLREVPFPVDLVDVFRRPELLGPVIDEVLEINAPAVWFQLGIRNDAELERATSRGIIGIQDRCILVEHRRLIGN